jgi:hypothetical protein
VGDSLVGNEKQVRTSLALADVYQLRTRQGNVARSLLVTAGIVGATIGVVAALRNSGRGNFLMH